MKHVQEHEGLVCVGVDQDTLQYKEVVEENGGKHVVKIKGPRATLNFQRNKNRGQIPYP